MNPFVQFDQVSYSRNGQTILSNLNLTIDPGQHLVVLGPNGAGKSSFIKLLTKDAYPTSGTITYRVQELSGSGNLQLKERIALFQPDSDLKTYSHYPHISLSEILVAGRHHKKVLFRETSREEEALVEMILKKFNHLTGSSLSKDRMFHTLSSGEKRKILLLKMMSSNPDLFIFDEPFESLDIPSRIELESLIRERTPLGKHVMITVLHRIEEIPEHATHGLLLKNGSIFQTGTIDEVMQSRNLSELYGVSLKIIKHSQRYACFSGIQE